jgi:hypothetical protein
MTKSKKHSPMQTETEPSIISQVPKESMKDFIEGLVAMAQARKAQQTSELSKEEQATETQKDPSLAALYGSEQTTPNSKDKEEE